MPDQRVDAAALLLSGMQFAVFERLPSGTFAGVNAYPDWFFRLIPNSSEQDPATSLTEHFPALEGFLPVAEEFWATPSTEQLQSDFWTETDVEGNEYHLLAIAITADTRHFLVMERADTTYIEHQQLQLYAHEMVIQYDTIARLNKEVERATRAKTEFLATMSHEIRTPLNAILGMADLLADTGLNDVQRKYVEVFQRAGANLLGLINDILDLSKVEAGQMELESVDFELSDVVRGVLDLTRGRASTKGLEVGSLLADSLPPVLVGDPLRLRQILLNLLGNAMKFTDSGRLDVEVAQDPNDSQPGALLFRVKDTGIGIPENKLGSIFENFSQADSSTTRKYGGTGLGLAISKRLVELMGGRIWVESTVGQGSTFLFTAKLGVSTHAASVSRSPETSSERKPVPQPSIASATAHILLADDSEDNRFLIDEYLKHSPHIVDFAENGEIALGKMKSGHYDLVLMDGHMPVMDGYAATRAMRAWELSHGARPIPILALTADAFKEALEKSVASGFNAHLTKPIGKATLLKAIRQYALPCDRPAAAPVVAEVEPSVAAMAPRYLKNIEKALQELRAAEPKQDYATIQRIGHNLHGTGGSFGFPLITEFGSAMEQAAKDQDMDRIQSAVLQFGSYLEQLLASL
jgi:signal transduction histidine kinase/CheY-like chemotaxis protein/HPt (histidine-containing phosphotransfer) domain-containing protein